MGQRVAEDVAWYISGNNEKMMLSEDGFCGNCGEYHDDCFCVGYWVRRTISEVASNKLLREEVEILREYGNKDCTAMADTVLTEVRKRR